MVARVELTDEALDDLRGLDGSARKLVVRALATLRDSPGERGAPLGSRRLGNLSGFRKLVVGDRQYRVIYRVEEDGSVCVVWVIGSRVDEECYQLAIARLALHPDAPSASRLSAALTDMWRGR
jgi:mRNA interferase RelE/StbE